MFRVGDKVLRKGGHRAPYLVGRVVAVGRNNRVQIAWPSNRIGGDGTMKTWLQANRLQPATEEEVARRRAKELERRRRWAEELERRYAGKTPAPDGKEE